MGHLPLFERVPAASVVRANLLSQVIFIFHVNQATQLLFSTEFSYWAILILLLLISLNNIWIGRLICLSFEYPWSAGAGPRPGGAWDRCFEDKHPKAIRVFSPIAARSQKNWVISPLVLPRSSLGHQPYCSSLGTVWFISLLFLSHTIWVISPMVFPVFGMARTPLRVPLSPL